MSFVCTLPVFADNNISPGNFSRDEALSYSQSVIGHRINNYTLTDHHGNKVDLSQYQGKPLVVSFIYTSCYHFCPTITSNLKKIVDIAAETLGPDSFNVVSIGFDAPVDTPENLGRFSEKLEIENENWKFLSVDSKVVESLTGEFGFIFTRTPKGFDHLAQITIVDQKGVVYRQIYGMDYTAQHFIEPLKELIYGQKNRLPATFSDWIDNIRLFCTVYDPATGRYQFDYSVFLSLLIGLLCLGSVLFFIIQAWRDNTV